MIRSFFCAILTFTAISNAYAGIVNGDFETGDFTGWDVNSYAEQGVLEATINDVGGNHQAVLKMLPISGLYIAVSQTFTINSKTPTVFSIDYSGQFHNTGSINYRISVIPFSGTTTSILLDQTYSSAGDYVVSPTTLTAVLDPGSYYVNVSLNRPFGIARPTGQLIFDNVQLSIVPEPSTLALALLGFVTVGLATRRKRR